MKKTRKAKDNPILEKIVMMKPEEFLDSEKGAKAAWKGFTSQTLYIANRLMLLEDECDFYPEKVEDLLIKRGGLPIETVQVKNINENLVLSHLNPQGSDSFFRRSLLLRKENNDLKLSIISFGSLGKELLEVREKENTAVQTIAERLAQKHGYTQEEASWLLSHLEIYTVDHEQLEEQIFQKLSRMTETMAAPSLAFDVLTNYISALSLKGEKTSRLDWAKKLHNIATDFAVISGFQQEYGRSLRPFFEYKTNLPLEILDEQYKIGINAHPDHVRNNLDLKRTNWLQRVETGFDEKQVVIIRGASGQGKSTLAYRHLVDTYPESNIFLIEQIENGTQAANIVTALSGLSIAKENNLIVHIDVTPYQTNWVWVIEQLQKTGKNIKLLVTIREEDYRRTVVDKSILQFEDIEVGFDKSEAEWIYEQYKNNRFRNFDEAWHSFGESGPLMEFIYLLNETNTLKEKLEAQINRIKLKEPDAQDWLKVLRLSGYAGRLNLNLNLAKVVRTLNSKNYEKMIYLFEKEYLLRKTNDDRYIEPLHAIRAELIYSILKDSALAPEEEMLLQTIECVDDFSQMLIVNYCYDKSHDSQLIEKIAAITFDRWANFASAISGILWIEVHKHHQINREILLEGDGASNSAFSFIAMADVTGLLGTFDLSQVLEIMKSQNPQGAERFEEIMSRIPRAYLGYKHLDIFFEKSRDSLPKYLPRETKEISSLGFALFWMSIRGYFIPARFDAKDMVELLKSADIDAALDLAEGIYSQKWYDLYKEILSILRDRICAKFGIIVLEESEGSISSQFITDVFDDNTKSDNSVHKQTMAVINALRKLYPGKEQYATKIIGADFMPGIPIADGEKNINAKYLPNQYVVELNRWFHNLHVYHYRIDTWNEYIENIFDIRNSITQTTQALLTGLDYLYKKNGNLNRLTDESFSELVTSTWKKLSTDSSRLPKSAMDRFGFSGESYEANKGEERSERSKEDYSGITLHSFQSATTVLFRKSFRDYCAKYSGFLDQKNALISSRVKRLEIDRDGRLSTINLTDAVSQLGEMQREFARLFTRLIDANRLEELHETESENLETLLNVWKFLEETNLQKVESVVYGQKKLLRKRKQDIEKFFTKDLRNLAGVKVVSPLAFHTSGKKVLYVTVELEKTDNFIKALYEEFKKRFPNSGTLTVDSLHIINFINQIIVCPKIGKYYSLGAIDINVRNLTNFDEEKFIKYVLPYEPDKYMKDHFNFPSGGNPIYHWNVLYASTNALKLILAHADKAIQTMSAMPPQTMIKDNVFYNWCDKGANSVSKLTSQMFVDFQALSEKLSQIPEAKEYLETSEEAIKIIDEHKAMFIKAPDKSQYQTLLNNLDLCFSELFLYAKAEVNSTHS